VELKYNGVAYIEINVLEESAGAFTIKTSPDKRLPGL